MAKSKAASKKKARNAMAPATAPTMPASNRNVEIREMSASLPVSTRTEHINDNLPASTDRYIVIYKKDASDPKTIHRSLSNIAGIKNVPTSKDFDGALTAEAMSNNKAVHFEKLGIAMITGEDEAMALSASVSEANSPILSIEPEYIAYLRSPADSGLEYIRGYRDAVNQIYNSLTQPGLQGQVPIMSPTESVPLSLFQDNDQWTWGLQATKVNMSRYTGQGIRVAVLDTGFDFQHPDFKGRSIISQTFSGESVDDIHSHGTHCIGTVCGPLKPVSGVRRYGIAYNAQIYVAKVFNNAVNPAAPTGNVIAGIEWALNNDCQVASLSLGVKINQQISQYDIPLRRALNAGLLIVAAAGNNAIRPDNPGFVEPPANSESTMAVAAIDNRLQIASFSARSSQLVGQGGKVDISGPGVQIFSSILSSQGSHGYFDGTSMATPHVSGIACLWAEATGERGAALWSKLTRNALPLSLLNMDIGTGLVQAP